MLDQKRRATPIPDSFSVFPYRMSQTSADIAPGEEQAQTGGPPALFQALAMPDSRSGTAGPLRRCAPIFMRLIATAPKEFVKKLGGVHGFGETLMWMFCSLVKDWNGFEIDLLDEGTYWHLPAH